MTTLRQRLIDDLKVRNRSAHTIKAYVACIANFARYFGKSPELLGPEEIRQYQVYLVNERRVSLSYLIQIVSALRFLYSVTLKRDWAISQIAYPRPSGSQWCSVKRKSSDSLTRYAGQSIWHS